MSIERVELGQIYEVVNCYGCGTFDQYSLNPKYIRIKRIDKNYDPESHPKNFAYEILDEDKYEVNRCGYCFTHKDLKPIDQINQPNQTIMSNLAEKFVTVFKSEPEKSFRKAGVTNGDDQLTTDGQTVFLSWLLKKHGNDFKTEVIDPILEDQKE